MRFDSRLAVLSLALVFFVASARLDAQQGDRVSMKIDVVAWGDRISGLSFKSGDRDGKITAHAFSYSEPVNYSGPRILEIHQSGDGTSEKPSTPGTPEDKEHESVPLVVKKPEGDSPQTPISKELARRREKEPTLVALVPLPANARRTTVLLARAAGGTYQGYVINDDPSKLPAGKLRVHNLSRIPIAMKFTGGQQTQLKRGQSFVADAQDGQIVYQLAYQNKGKWKVQENNIIPVRPEEQTQLIVLKSNNRFFLSTDGAAGGHLQMVTLRRQVQ